MVSSSFFLTQHPINLWNHDSECCDIEKKEDENEYKQSKAKKDNDDKCGAPRNNTTVTATKSTTTKSTATKPGVMELTATHGVDRHNYGMKTCWGYCRPKRR